jgi:hypothetical protein
MFAGLAGAFAIYPALTGQFWPYHWLPFVYFALILASLAFAGRDGRHRPRWETASFVVVVLLLLSFVARLAPPAVGAIVESAQGRTPPPKGGRVDAIAGYLQQNLRPGDTVQSLDCTGGALHAMLIARVRVATRFMTDFHFYHHVSSPYVQSLRRTFMDELERSNPRFIVEIATLYKPVPRGPDTSLRFPQLRGYIASRYRVAASSIELGYEIYERVAGQVSNR